MPTVEVPIRMLYPNGTKTVEGAINYMLEPHSYCATFRDATGDIIAQRTFIDNFNNDPVPLYIAMERLLGQDGQIILDQNRKLYTFRVRNPNEPSVAFADLTATHVNKNALQADDYSKDSIEPEEILADTPEFCYSIQFRNQSMLSAAVQEYFLRCGFKKVLWSLGEPGRYADYRLLQNLTLPLPKRHFDLIEFLQSRFGIKTLIHDEERVEFNDENNTL